MTVTEETPVTVSVIVPVLNAAGFVPACLERLTNQVPCGVPSEIIVVDDGSTDGSDIAAQRFPGVIVLHHDRADHDRADPYRARNRGVETARGRILAFTDAHCVVPPDWLSRVWQAFHERDAELVLGPIDFPEGGSRLLRLYAAYHRTKMGFIYSHDMRDSFFCHAANLAVQRSLFEQLGGFKPLPTPGDTEIVQRLVRERPQTRLVYLTETAVRRQSVSTLVELLLQTRKHAKYNDTLTTRGTFQTLSWQDRWRVYQQCRRERRLSIADSARLLMALAAGVIVYKWSQLRERRWSS